MAASLPATAHHSFAGYEMTKTLTAKATIKEFRWGAPHCYGVFVIVDADGTEHDLTVATAAPANLFKQGLGPRDFKTGEKVDLAWHPSRNGNLGGALAGIRFADGREFKDTESEKFVSSDVATQSSAAQ